METFRELVKEKLIALGYEIDKNSDQLINDTIESTRQVLNIYPGYLN